MQNVVELLRQLRPNLYRFAQQLRQLEEDADLIKELVKEEEFTKEKVWQAITLKKECLKNAMQKREMLLRYTRHSKKRAEHERQIKSYQLRLKRLERLENKLEEIGK